MWRCHIGTERTNEYTEEGWRFLEPFVAPCRAFVFSHRGFVPPGARGSRSPYHCAVDRPVFREEPTIERCTGEPDPGARSASLAITGRCGSTGSVLRGAGPVQLDDRLVVQVSRRDRLKDMQGVLEGFAAMVEGHAGLRLALVGPEVKSVSDDPEDAGILEECLAAWENLPQKFRSAIRIVGLPMNDVEINGLMVNAIQRHATVVVQKSLEEGFGLDGRRGHVERPPGCRFSSWWHRRPGCPWNPGLARDPSDLSTFGRVLADLLADPEQMTA